MGHIGDHLRNLLEARETNFVNHERQKNGKRKGEHQIIEGKQQRVPHQLPEVGRLNKTSEVFQANPAAAQDALFNFKIAKGNLNAVNRNITKNQHIQKGR